MDGTYLGPLRMWRFEEEDITAGQTYILRGMRVAVESSWDYELMKYMPRADGKRTVECTSRTAAEDVTHVNAIQAYFSG